MAPENSVAAIAATGMPKGGAGIVPETMAPMRLGNRDRGKLQIHANVIEPGITKHSHDLGDERGARSATRVGLEIASHGSRNFPERDHVGDRPG